MARALRIEVSSEDIEMVKNTIAGKITDAIFNDVKDRNIRLQFAATEFLDVALATVKQIKTTIQNLDMVQKGANMVSKQNFPITTATYRSYFNKEKIQKLQDISQIEKFLAASMTFNERIISILYDKPLKTIVVIQGQDPQIYELSGEQLTSSTGVTIYRDFASKTRALVGRLRFSAPELERNVQDITKLVGQNGANDEQNLMHLNTAYANARFDYETFLPTKYAFYRASPSEPWKRILVSGGYGDLAEAYASFFLMELFKFSGAAPWPNLVIYFEDGVAKVDNSSGLYSADILGDKANYAVKAAKADLPGYTQMLQLAQKIILASTGKNGVTWDDVNAIIKKEQDKANKARDAIRNGIEEVTEKALQENLSGIGVLEQTIG